MAVEQMMGRRAAGARQMSLPHAVPGGSTTTEQDAYELLFARYTATRARHLVGVLRLLTLYGAEELIRRGWITPQGLDPSLRDLRLAGITWPLTDDRDADDVTAGDQRAAED